MLSGSWTGAVCAVVAVSAAAGAAALAVPGGRRPRPRGTPPSRDARDRRGLPASSGSPGSPGDGADLPVLRWLGTAGVLLGVVFLVGGWRGLAAGLPAAGACWWWTGRTEPPAVRRRRERLVASVPHAVDLLAACLSAGLSPGAGLELVVGAVDPPLAEELAAVDARLRLGVDPATVWRDLARHTELGGLGRAVSRAVDSGASVADAMQRLASDLRRAARAEAETRARAVGVKAAVPLGVCLLPAFVLVGVVPLVAGSLSVLLRP